jgi:hypothetical protein
MNLLSSCHIHKSQLNRRSQTCTVLMLSCSDSTVLDLLAPQVMMVILPPGLGVRARIVATQASESVIKRKFTNDCQSIT